MSILAAKHQAVPNGREAVDIIRGKVVQFRSAALPRVALAAENAGEAVSKIALSTSKNVAGALRKRAPNDLEKFATLLPAGSLARSAARFALRNPAVLVLTGVGIAAIGYVAWRRQQAVEPEA
jgi:hypothetical protein